MQDLVISSKIRDYKVHFETSFDFVKRIQNINPSIFVIDSKIYEIYKAKLFSSLEQDKLIVFDATEKNKVLGSAEKLYEEILQHKAKRNLNLISFGGGIVQDVTGFVASTLYRGINWIYAPTTFLSQIDSCIGSKTSLNFKSYKNVIGTFYPPSEIYISSDFLDSLPDEFFYSGIGELIKFLLMKEEPKKNLEDIIKKVKRIAERSDKKLLLAVIREGLAVKQAFITGDEFDKGRRNLLNYGHTLGHALETSSNFAIPHGVAVTVGLVFANTVANMRGLLSDKIYHIINEKILIPGFPKEIEFKKEYFEKSLLLENVKKDKKRIGNALALVVPVADNFKLEKINDLSNVEFEEALGKLKKIINV